jgi:hypothetical protein
MKIEIFYLLSINPKSTCEQVCSPLDAPKFVESHLSSSSTVIWNLKTWFRLGRLLNSNITLILHSSWRSFLRNMQSLLLISYSGQVQSQSDAFINWLGIGTGTDFAGDQRVAWCAGRSCKDPHVWMHQIFLWISETKSLWSPTIRSFVFSLPWGLKRP